MKTRKAKTWKTPGWQIVLTGMVVGVLLVPCAYTELLGEWTLNEGGGTTAFDTSGNGNDGTLTGGATFITDDNGTGVSLDGANGSFIEFGTNSIFDLTAPFSMEAWFVTFEAADDIIFARTDPTPVLGLESSNFGADFFMFYPGEDKFPNNPIAPRETGTLVHVVGTYDGTTAAIYKNGVLADTLATNITPVVTTNSLRAGANNTGENAMNGVLYTLRIWSNTLDAAKVSMLFEQGISSVVTSATVTAANTLGASFLSESNRKYRLQSAPDLIESNIFTDTGARVEGTGGLITLFDPTGSSTSKFYRVLED